LSHPVAYLRKSRVTTDRHVSWEVQESKIRELATIRGDAADLLILSDWNKSGTKGAAGRPGYRRLLEMIAAGEVSAVYAYSLSRLGRSVPELRRVTDLCVKHGVPVVFADGEPREVTSTWGKFMLNILGSVAEMEADIAAERSRDVVAVRRARGDRIGPAFYGDLPGEDLAAVVAAYKEAGSVLGAARLLNVRGVPTRQGRPWSTTPVRELLLRTGSMPFRGRPGVKAAAPFVLYRLLRCHCGRTMTGSRYRNGSNPAYTVYRCVGGRTDVKHHRQSISEVRLLPWAQAQAARFRIPAGLVKIRDRDERGRLALEERRRRVIDNFESALIDRAERDRKVAAIDTELERFDTTERVVTVPRLDWSWDAKAINSHLRALWEYVELDADLRPIRAEWLLPPEYVS
jgi:DNA invertase Pin-like site-specific DNA recombinase